MLKHRINDKREWYRTIYLKSEHWKELREQKLKESPQCVCGATDHLVPHHLRYRNIFDVRLSDLVVLCRRCHTEEHKRLDALKPQFRRKLPSKLVYSHGYSERWVNPSRRWWFKNKTINEIRDRIIAELADQEYDEGFKILCKVMNER